MERRRTDFFELIHATTQEGKTSASLGVHYKGFDSCLFIEPGSSLVFLIDGAKETLSTPTGSRRSRRIDGQNVRESAIYPISLELCERISKAATVKVRVIGDRYVDKDVPDAAKKVFADFAAKHK